MKSVSISLGAVIGAGLASLVLAASAHAQHARVTSIDAEQARANLEASMKAAAKGQKVGMLTGQRNPQPVTHADGTVSQELDAGTMSYTIARRNADGTIDMVCVEGADAAQKALKAPTFAKRMGSSTAKEQRDVK